MGKTVVIVSGLSGAGRTTALATLSDLGFQSSDAVPPSLWAALIDASEGDRIALGWPIDASGDHLFPSLPEDCRTRHLFLAADQETLRRRYSEARRVHPLDQGKGLVQGIEAEATLSLPRRASADHVLDTSGIKLSDFRSRIAAFVETPSEQLQIRSLSFSYRLGLPVDADMVFDMRWLRNPHYESELRPKTGQDLAVAAFIRDDEAFDAFESHLRPLLSLIAQRQAGEGKAYFTIAFGCTGGKHRSVFMAETAAQWLSEGGAAVSVVHRDVGLF